MHLFESFPPAGVPKGERSEAESNPSASLRVKTTFMPSGPMDSLRRDEALHFGPLRDPPVEMTKTQILIIIVIRERFFTALHSVQNDIAST